MKNLTGYLILGQNVDKERYKVNELSNTFFGELKEMYLYHIKLTAEEVSFVYQHAAIKKKIAIGWWEFKEKSNVSEIIETKYTF